MASLTPCLDLKRRRSMWYKRLAAEWRFCTGTTFFVTLTYDEDHVPMEFGDDGLPNFYAVSKRDVQLFFKRFRKHYSEQVGRLRYFIVSEFGDLSFRPHYHAVFFTDRPCTVEFMKTAILKTWIGGYIIDVQLLKHGGGIRYITNYITKGLKAISPTDMEGFCLMSRRPGIGYRYVERFKRWHRFDCFEDVDVVIGHGPVLKQVDDFPKRKFFIPMMDMKFFRNLRSQTGIVPSLPRYFAEKIYLPYERKRMSDSLLSQAGERVRKWFEAARRSHPDLSEWDVQIHLQPDWLSLDWLQRERLARMDIERTKTKHRRKLRERFADIRGRSERF